MNEVEFEKYKNNAKNLYAPDIKNWTPPDHCLFGPKKLYDLAKKDAEDLRFKAIKYSFLRNYNNSKFYNRFCKDLEINPEDIKTEEDYKKIPLISDIFFKDHPDAGKGFIDWLEKIYVGDFPNISKNKKYKGYDEIIKLFQNEKISLVFSSGTSGRFSFIPRDAITWARQMFVCASAFEMSPCSFHTPDSTIIWLGPDPKKTHMYIGRLTLMLYDLYKDSSFNFGIDRELTTRAIQLLMGSSKGVFQKILGSIIRPFILHEENKILEGLTDILEKAEKEDKKIGIGGTPFFIEMFLSKIEKRGLKFEIENGMVLTAGGWKRFSGAAIPEEKFREKINKILGIPHENCRDIYGMVECNSLNVSCEGHYKHIPHSIIYPMVLDNDSEPIGYNEYGRFAFIDPLANSYPGFIMTGDRVKILEQCPECERKSPVICGEVSRFSGIQDRGCGAVLARMFTEEVKKTKELDEK